MSTVTVTRTPIRSRGQLMKLARYDTPTGERWLVGRRVDGVVGVVDTPAPGTPGVPYLVEDDIANRAELIALLRDYLTESRAHGVPAIVNNKAGMADAHIEVLRS
jgi:hypothetical protein